jgi:transcriptional regulator with XRE-family HTH domain
LYGDEYLSRQLVGARLRLVRLRLGLSQQALAVALKAIGLELGEPNNCTKRLVQKWESGEHKMPSAQYRRAIAWLTGEKFLALCAPIPPDDVTDAARRVSKVMDVVTVLQAELLDLHGFLNAELETGHGHRQ